MPNAISIVIPAFNSAEHLKLCLDSLLACRESVHQIIVVDDGSTDDTRQVASEFQVELVQTAGRKGPAYARNLGASVATGDILLFLDSDVCVRRDTVEKIRASFEADPALDALIGSYDSEPSSQDFLSQYRNLMHAFVHQTGDSRASTFWSGCGAIRRDLFLRHSGFSEDFERPAIEDIELGYRLVRDGRKLVLDRTIQVTHLKRWTFWNLVKTDILDRGIPWTELILRDRFMPDDLNLQLSQRVSVALIFILVALSGFIALSWGGYFLIPLFAIIFMMLTRWWGEFADSDRPRSAPFLLCAVVSLISILAYEYRMPALIPPLLLSPGLLFVRHRYAGGRSRPKMLRWLALTYSLGSILLAGLYLPMKSLIFAGFIILAALGLMNSQFYIFLAGNRGVPFMLAAIPFHLLYHFYNGISFTVGLLRHLWTGATGRRERAVSPW